MTLVHDHQPCIPVRAVALDLIHGVAVIGEGTAALGGALDRDQHHGLVVQLQIFGHGHFLRAVGDLFHLHDQVPAVGVSIQIVVIIHGLDHIFPIAEAAHGGGPLRSCGSGEGLIVSRDGVVAALALVQREVVGHILAHRACIPGGCVLNAVAGEHDRNTRFCVGGDPYFHTSNDFFSRDRVGEGAIVIGSGDRYDCMDKGIPVVYTVNYTVGVAGPRGDDEGVVIQIGDCLRALGHILLHIFVNLVFHIVLLGGLAGAGDLHIAGDILDGVGVICAEGQALGDAIAHLHGEGVGIVAVHRFEGEAAAVGDQAGLVRGERIRQGHGEVIGVDHGVGVGNGGIRGVEVDGVGIQIKFGVGQLHGGGGSRLGGEVQSQCLAQGHGIAVAADPNGTVVVLHRQVGGVTGLGVQGQCRRVVGKGHVIGVEAGDALFPGGDGHRDTHLLARSNLLVSTHGNSIAGSCGDRASPIRCNSHLNRVALAMVKRTIFDIKCFFIHLNA